MPNLRPIAERLMVLLALLPFAVFHPAAAESAADRLSRMQAELERVDEELRWTRYFDDPAKRASLEEEVAHLELERSKLLSVMPERVDAEDLLAQLNQIAESRGVGIATQQPTTADHDTYKTITIRVTPEGAEEAIDGFVLRVRTSRGVKRVTEIEEGDAAGDLDVTAFMIPPESRELRPCSIPEASPTASEREAALREMLISECAALEARDPKLRALVVRRKQLQDWIALTARLKVEASSDVASEDDFDDDDLFSEILSESGS